MKRPRIPLKRMWLISAAAGCVSCLNSFGQDIDLSKLPPSADVTIDYVRDIQPILKENCLRCHGPEKPKSGFRLDNREDALNSGEYGGNIIVGDSAHSPLIQFVSHLVEEWEMPPPDKGEKLTDEQIGLLRAWIDQGLVWPDTALENPIQFSVTTGIRYIAVSGNEQRFRQITGTREGFSGGVTDFDYQQRIDKDTQFNASGRIWDEPDSYELDLRYRKRGLGYIRVNVEQFRTYYNDVGGYYQPFDNKSFSLNQDLELDQGNVLVEVGLTKPKWPFMSLSYEYRYRDGAKSITQWGEHTEGIATRSIRPSFKDIDQDLHIVRFDFDYDLHGYRIQDQARLEWLDLDTARQTDGSSSSGLNPVTLDRITRTEDNYEHFQGANFIRLEKQIKPWLLVSGGHHFSRIDGEARLNRSSVFFLPDPVAFVDADSQRIVLDRYSNTLNANTRLGPWEGLTFSAGVQGDWTHQEGMGGIFFFELPDPGSVESDFERDVIQEQFILKYDRIPYTVVYAESSLQQDDIDQRERQRSGATDDFDRNTHVDGNHREFGGGIEVSPWTWGSLNLRYSNRVRDNDFDHRVDESMDFDPGESGNGYSAFIRGFKHEKNEFKAKLSLRPFTNLKVKLAYQLIRTDYATTTDPATGLVFVNGQPERRVIAPGGEVEAGEYSADVYSLGFTYTPIRRLYLNGSFSYRDAKTETFANGVAAVVPYKSETYSVLASGVYIIDEKTDVNGGYTFSHSDSTQNNAASSLPYGMDYEWHQVYTGLTRRINESLTTYWQYAFYYYDEPTSGNVNDFTGHGFFASLTWRWR